MNKRVKTRKIWKPIVQLTFIIIGLIPGYTQGINYWHHWSDIMTGYSVGVIFAFLVTKYVAKL